MSEQEKTITYDTGTVSFDCACGEPLTITRLAPESIMSGVFCQKCDEQWYIYWSEAILRKGHLASTGFFDMSKKPALNWGDTVGYRPSITDVHEHTKAGE